MEEESSVGGVRKSMHPVLGNVIIGSRDIERLIVLIGSAFLRAFTYDVSLSVLHQDID